MAKKSEKVEVVPKVEITEGMKRRAEKRVKRDAETKTK